MKTTFSILGLLLFHFGLFAAQPPILRNVLTTNLITLGATMSLSVGNVLDSAAGGGVTNLTPWVTDINGNLKQLTNGYVKLKTAPASAALITDGQGFITNSATTAGELLFLSGVSSAIQTQINGKQPTNANLTLLQAFGPAQWQSTNAALTALAGNASLYQATNANLTLLQSFGPTQWQSTNAALTALAGNANLYQATNGTLTRVAGIGTGVSGDVLYRDAIGWTNLAKGADGTVLKLASGLPAWGTDSTAAGSGDNWSASGTTNSTLPGVASVNSIVVSNLITANAFNVGTLTVTNALPSLAVSGTASVYDLVVTNSLLLPIGTAPTVDAFGEIAGDNNLWAAGRGAPIFFDGTASVGLIGALVSDVPSNGQVPTWNTGGTITWETPSSGGGAPVGTMVNSGASTSAQYAKYADITGTNLVPDTITLASADFANQGTTTTVLHGNASGNPSFGAVDLTGTEVTGALKAASFPTLTGDITTAGGALATTLATVGTPGTYTSVTTDTKGRVTAGTNPTHSYVGGGSINSVAVTTAVQYLSPFGATGPAGTEANSSQLVPVNTTFKNLYVKLVSLSAGTNVVCTLMTNGVASSLTCNGNTTAGEMITISDLTHTVPVLAGTSVNLRINSVTVDAAGIGVKWTFQGVTSPYP